MNPQFLLCPTLLLNAVLTIALVLATVQVQAIFQSRSFILKKAKQPYFMCKMKKLEKTIDAEFEVFKVRCCLQRRKSRGAQKVCKVQSCDVNVLADIKL